MIWNLRHQTNRPIFLIELDCIRIKSLQFTMPKPAEFALFLKAIIRRHDYTQVSIIGHSFGSVTASWFLKYYPEMVTHLTLLDPVSILLSLPTVAYSFLYRQPKNLKEAIIYVFASTELTISYTLRRKFFWYRSILWLNDITNQTGVVIGIAENDEILHPLAIYEHSRQFQVRRRHQCKSHILDSGLSSDDIKDKYLDTDDSLSNTHSDNVHVHYWSQFSHGQILFDYTQQCKLIETIQCNENLSKLK